MGNDSDYIIAAVEGVHGEISSLAEEVREIKRLLGSIHEDMNSVVGFLQDLSERD